MGIESLKRPDVGGYTGQVFERDCFQPCRKEVVGEVKYMPFKEAVDWVKKHQPAGWDPRNPGKQISSNLRRLVVDKLGETGSGLMFYTALKSPLDEFHGVDGFFELGDKRVTVDVTRNRSKTEYKADLVISDRDLITADGELSPDAMDRVAQDIAKKFGEEKNVSANQKGVWSNTGAMERLAAKMAAKAVERDSGHKNVRVGEETRNKVGQQVNPRRRLAR